VGELGSSRRFDSSNRDDANAREDQSSKEAALPSRRLRREDENQMVQVSPSLPLPVQFFLPERLLATGGQFGDLA
jgi:hypothetical protein